MKQLVLFIISIVAGSVAGIFIPADIINNTVVIVARILTRAMLYLTIPYFIFSIIINSFELKDLHLFGAMLKYSITRGLFTIVVLTLVSMIIFLFIPHNSSISFIPDIPLDTYTPLLSIIEILFPSNFIQVLSSSHTSIAAILIVCCLIGTMAVNNIQRGNVFFDVIDAMRSINLRIVRVLLPYFTIGILFASAVLSSTIINYEQLYIITKLFLFLAVLLLSLLFVIYPVLLRILGVKISFRLWYTQVIPAMSTALSTTNVLASGTLLLHVEELGYSRKRNSEMSTSFALVFCRAGTAVTFALSYLFIYKVYSSIPMDISFFVMVFIGAIITSYLSSTITSSILISAIITFSQIPSINVHDSYIILIPVQLVLMGFAAGIDAVSCSFMQLFIANKIQKLRKEQQGFGVELDEEYFESQEEALYDADEEIPPFTHNKDIHNNKD